MKLFPLMTYDELCAMYDRFKAAHERWYRRHCFKHRELTALGALVFVLTLYFLSQMYISAVEDYARTQTARSTAAGGGGYGHDRYGDAPEQVQP